MKYLAWILMAGFVLTGNVWYRGKPTVTTDISGVGNINPTGN